MVSSVRFVDLAAQHQPLADELVAAFRSVVSAGGFVLGDELTSFEEEFAAYSETRFAVGPDSGLSALELVLRASGIGPGDEVITAANTFAATVFAIAHAGARPVLVDVDPVAHTLDPELFSAAVTRRTRAVIPVHLYGHPAAMDPIREIAAAHDILVFEDACQAHGARYRGARVGSLSTGAAFSFFPAKNLGAFGDGGIVVTDHEELADALRVLRNYGQRSKYDHVSIGFNRRLDTLQAAILRIKLRRLDGWNEARRHIAATYGRLLGGQAGLTIPTASGDVEPAWHLYVIRVRDRDALRAFLESRGIATGIHYPVPIHLLPACRYLGYPRGRFPVTERLAGEILSLPMYPELRDDAIERICVEIQGFLVDAGDPAPSLELSGSSTRSELPA
jgi:dTDP-4-amino-4,6-dideoxygalactose transaminase